MREIDIERGTENGEAKFASVFGLSTKKHRGALWSPPPIGSRVNNDHQSAVALILHISIATNNHQCFEKLIRQTISLWTEDLSGHTKQSF